MDFGCIEQQDVLLMVVAVPVDILVVVVVSVENRLQQDVPLYYCTFHNNLFVVVVLMYVEWLKLVVLFELFPLNVGMVVVLLKLVDSAVI